MRDQPRASQRKVGFVLIVDAAAGQILEKGSVPVDGRRFVAVPVHHVQPMGDFPHPVPAFEAVEIAAPDHCGRHAVLCFGIDEGQVVRLHHGAVRARKLDQRVVYTMGLLPDADGCIERADELGKLPGVAIEDAVVVRGILVVGGLQQFASPATRGQKALEAVVDRLAGRKLDSALADATQLPDRSVFSPADPGAQFARHAPFPHGSSAGVDPSPSESPVRDFQAPVAALVRSRCGRKERVHQLAGLPGLLEVGKRVNLPGSGSPSTSINWLPGNETCAPWSRDRERLSTKPPHRPVVGTGRHGAHRERCAASRFPLPMRATGGAAVEDAESRKIVLACRCFRRFPADAAVTSRYPLGASD